MRGDCQKAFVVQGGIYTVLSRCQVPLYQRVSERIENTLGRDRARQARRGEIWYGAVRLGAEAPQNRRDTENAQNALGSIIFAREGKDSLKCQSERVKHTFISLWRRRIQPNVIVFLFGAKRQKIGPQGPFKRKGARKRPKTRECDKSHNAKCDGQPRDTRCPAQLSAVGSQGRRAAPDAPPRA